ncbi:hypothetical protein AB0C14_36305 [Microbispora hainanensis]|uniref:hypothetical protein n=1 Tax=Microbispora hainanensis TaxID=568844 RepID=UPI0033E80ACA
MRGRESPGPRGAGAFACPANRRTAEVGYESPTGSLQLGGGEGPTLKGLTVRGPGSYRVRVHLRGRKLVYQVAYPPDGAVELLVQVFPGKARKPVVYR